MKKLVMEMIVAQCLLLFGAVGRSQAQEIVVPPGTPVMELTGERNFVYQGLFPASVVILPGKPVTTLVNVEGLSRVVLTVVEGQSNQPDRLLDFRIGFGPHPDGKYYTIRDFSAPYSVSRAVTLESGTIGFSSHDILVEVGAWCFPFRVEIPAQTATWLVELLCFTPFDHQLR